MSVFWTEDEWHPNTRTTYICTQYLSNSSVLFLMPVDNISYKTHFSVVWHEAQSTDDIIKSRVSFHHSCLKPGAWFLRPLLSGTVTLAYD